jgi:hypothetical protein
MNEVTAGSDALDRVCAVEGTANGDKPWKIEVHRLADGNGHVPVMELMRLARDDLMAL